MRRMLTGLGVVMILLPNLGWIDPVYAQGQRGTVGNCPPGMVWGGHRCEVRELCVDGYPADAQGSCQRSEVKPPRMPNPPVQLPVQTVSRARHACEDGIVFYPDGALPTNGVNRSLIIANGSVAEHLEAYINEMARLDIAIEYKTFSVYFREDGKPEPVRLREGEGVEPWGFSKVLFMTSRKKLWLDAAATLKAQPVNHVQLNEDIDRYRADALCGR